MLGLLEALGLGFTLVTLPLGLWALLVLGVELAESRGKEASSAFFKLCLVLVSFDMVNLFNNYFLYLFPKWGWNLAFVQAHPEPVMYTSFYISWAMGIGQILFTFLLALNRYTTILQPELNTKLWSGRTCNLFIGLNAGTSLLFGLLVFGSPVAYFPNQTGGLNQRLTNDKLSHSMYAVAGALLFSTSCFIVFGYTSILRRLRRVVGAATGGRALQRTRERKLLAMSAIVCGMQLVNTGYIVLKFTINIDPSTDLYNLLNTIFSGINPYLLFGFSDVMRRRLREIVGCPQLLSSDRRGTSSRALSGTRTSRPPMHQNLSTATITAAVPVSVYGHRVKK